ncbi:uncharacterized protein UV8b_03571 [Ustilaginoidea virens]|uniref:Uncharacterized protein n=1 Tax=Ustilaginoidea virens TaxID=1159556 RepID=A0A8E5HPK2_USTVR|nr:uncharacterized protein UV8b_03571 [Ustilaginoidea virens]QUC19330.1 hypothetical protein UV8b_03571 [Ustilaginoidea virens]
MPLLGCRLGRSLGTGPDRTVDFCNGFRCRFSGAIDPEELRCRMSRAGADSRIRLQTLLGEFIPENPAADSLERFIPESPAADSLELEQVPGLSCTVSAANPSDSSCPRSGTQSPASRSRRQAPPPPYNPLGHVTPPTGPGTSSPASAQPANPQAQLPPRPSKLGNQLLPPPLPFPPERRGWHLPPPPFPHARNNHRVSQSRQGRAAAHPP